MTSYFVFRVHVNLIDLHDISFHANAIFPCLDDKQMVVFHMVSDQGPKNGRVQIEKINANKN